MPCGIYPRKFPSPGWEATLVSSAVEATRADSRLAPSMRSSEWTNSDGGGGQAPGAGGAPMFVRCFLRQLKHSRFLRLVCSYCRRRFHRMRLGRIFGDDLANGGPEFPPWSAHAGNWKDWTCVRPRAEIIRLSLRHSPREGKAKTLGASFHSALQAQLETQTARGWRNPFRTGAEASKANLRPV